MEKEFYIDIWNFFEIEQVNEALDDAVEDGVLPTDISYECVEITKEGQLKLKATFENFHEEE